MNKKKIGIMLLILLIFMALFICKDGQVIVFAAIATVLYGTMAKISVELAKDKIHGSLKINEKNKRVEVIVKNDSWIPWLTVEASVNAENLIKSSKDDATFVFEPGAKKEKGQSFEIRESHCGAVEIILSEIIISDIFGIVKKTVNAYEKVVTYVLPKMKEIHQDIEKLHSYNMESFKFSPNKKGGDTSEIFGINTYKPGDSIKSIHWKMSCKMDDIVIREAGLPIENNIMILVDKSDNNDQKFKGKLRSDFTEYAVSLSKDLVENKMNHCIGWFNKRKKEFQIFAVKEEGDIWNYMPELLASPYYEGGDSAAVKFMESNIDKKFSNILLVSNSDRDKERLTEYGEVHICGRETIK